MSGGGSRFAEGQKTEQIMNGKWIWTKEESGIDVYGEFKTEFVYGGGKISLEISADSEYAVDPVGVLNIAPSARSREASVSPQ